MRALRYTTAAMENIADIAEYVARQAVNKDVGERFAVRLEHQCAKLARLQGTLGRPRPELAEGVRSFPFGRYIIFFRYLENTVEIVNVLAGHRDIAAYFANRHAESKRIRDELD